MAISSSVVDIDFSASSVVGIGFGVASGCSTAMRLLGQSIALRSDHQHHFSRFVFITVGRATFMVSVGANPT